MSIKPLSAQIRPLIAVFLCAYCPTFILLSVVALISSKTNVPIATFVRDATAVAGVPLYTGALSQFGILLWCASTSVCLLTATALHRASYGSKVKVFILCLGLLTAVLMLDDAFLIHERIAPRYFGLPNNVLFSAYGIITIIGLVTFRHLIFQADYILLATSLVFFAASIVFDKIHDYEQFYRLGVDSQDVKFLLEDGFKLGGIVGWCAFCTNTCLMALVNMSRVKLLQRNKVKVLH